MDTIIVEYWSSLSAAEQQSMVIIIAAAVMFVILERIFPYTKNQRILREGFFDDLALYTV
ncbi:MAG: sterol desaturase family protein, partial [Bacteroidetes bacterium]|nr:sterol desaturase family protein [Bacteroidota bacterium]